MAQSRLKRTGSNSIEYSIVRPDGTQRTFNIDQSTSYDWSISKRPGEMFNVGAGLSLDQKDYVTNNQPEYDFGSHLLLPHKDFTAWVQMWGGGGGGYHSSGNVSAGGGGYTQGLVQFKSDVSYTIMVGQAGRHGNQVVHGGGGRGHEGGGTGGGLSGLFMGSTHYGKTAWSHGTTPPVTRAQALLIAGGGGGKGHHSQSHHGGGGGGGGWTGGHGHNVGAGTQTGGGHAGYNNAGGGGELQGGHSGSGSWNGGGGGGWYGGGGGGHTSSHYNGGGGGSGHHAYPSFVASQPNNDKAPFIITAHTERAVGYHDSNFPGSGNPYSPLALGEGGHMAGHGGFGTADSHAAPSSPINGKVVITLAPDILNNPTYQFPQHTAAQDPNGWTQSY